LFGERRLLEKDGKKDLRYHWVRSAWINRHQRCGN